jgi:GTP-binding protein HflX
VAESDILLHVVDISHPLYHEQMEVVNETLNELGAGEKPQIVIYNKIDQVESEELDEFEGDILEYFASRSIMNGNSGESVYISATKKLNIQALKALIFKQVKKEHLRIYPNYLHPDTY